MPAHYNPIVNAFEGVESSFAFMGHIRGSSVTDTMADSVARGGMSIGIDPGTRNFAITMIHELGKDFSIGFKSYLVRLTKSPSKTEEFLTFQDSVLRKIIARMITHTKRFCGNGEIHNYDEIRMLIEDSAPSRTGLQIKMAMQRALLHNIGVGRSDISDVGFIAPGTVNKKIFGHGRISAKKMWEGVFTVAMENSKEKIPAIMRNGAHNIADSLAIALSRYEWQHPLSPEILQEAITERENLPIGE